MGLMGDLQLQSLEISIFPDCGLGSRTMPYYRRLVANNYGLTRLRICGFRYLNAPDGVDGLEVFLWRTRCSPYLSGDLTSRKALRDTARLPTYVMKPRSPRIYTPAGSGSRYTCIHSALSKHAGFLRPQRAPSTL